MDMRLLLRGGGGITKRARQTKIEVSWQSSRLTARIRNAQRLSTVFMTYTVPLPLASTPVRAEAGLTSSTRQRELVDERVERGGKSSSESATVRRRFVGPLGAASPSEYTCGAIPKVDQAHSVV